MLRLLLAPSMGMEANRLVSTLPAISAVAWRSHTGLCMQCHRLLAEPWLCCVAGVWRRKAIVTVGGWKSRTTVEDMDLSLRTYVNGWKAIYLSEVTCINEVLPPAACLLMAHSSGCALYARSTPLPRSLLLPLLPASHSRRAFLLVLQPSSPKIYLACTHCQLCMCHSIRDSLHAGLQSFLGQGECASAIAPGSLIYMRSGSPAFCRLRPT